MGQNTLNEIVLYRTIVTLLLIVTHSFTIFGGSWSYPPGIEPCTPYLWIVHFAANAMLGGFTFISGYLLIHQREKIMQQTFESFLRQKLQRLLLPGVLFSILYLEMFEEHTFSAFLHFCYTLSTGHMWYLPMLMWCLILGYYLLKYDISLKKTIGICLILLFFYFLPLPFQLNRFLYYSIYFVFGMVMYEYRNKIVAGCKLLLNWGGYLFAFIVLMYVILYLNDTLLGNVLLELVIKETRTYIRVLSGIIGVWIYWRTSLYITKHYTIPAWIQSISRHSFGIYLYQQFILQFLLYHTSLPQHVGTFCLPWVCLLLTILLSWCFASLTSRTKVGKFLIG